MTHSSNRSFIRRTALYKCADAAAWRPLLGLGGGLLGTAVGAAGGGMYGLGAIALSKERRKRWVRTLLSSAGIGAGVGAVGGAGLGIAAAPAVNRAVNVGKAVAGSTMLLYPTLAGYHGFLTGNSDLVNAGTEGVKAVSKVIPHSLDD